MAREISWEIRERAEELYIVDGRTYDQVAEATGVSVPQLKRWARDGGWSERKKEYCEALSDIRRKKVLLRKKLLENAYNSLDPQAVYAAARMEAVAAKAMGKGESAAEVAVIDPVAIKTPAEAVAALQAAVERRVNTMLAGGEISLKGIKEMKAVLDLWEKMRAEYETDQDSGKHERQLDPETIKSIRELYGLTS